MPHNVHHIYKYEECEMDIAVREVCGGFQIAYMTVKQGDTEPPFLVTTRSYAMTYLTMDMAIAAGRKIIRQSIVAGRCPVEPVQA